MLKILEITRTNSQLPDAHYIQQVPFHQRVCKLWIPHPPSDFLDGTVATVTVKVESETVFVEAPKGHFLLDSVSIQFPGEYELFCGNVLSMGKFHWTFRLLQVPHYGGGLPGPYVVPCEADLSIVTTMVNGNEGNLCRGSVLGRDLMGDYRKKPLWLPGNRDANTPRAWLERELFFHLKWMGEDITNPPNTGHVNFFKAILHHYGKKHPSMAGEIFDEKWKFVTKLNVGKAENDEEMMDHIVNFLAVIESCV